MNLLDIPRIFGSTPHPGRMTTATTDMSTRVFHYYDEDQAPHSFPFLLKRSQRRRRLQVSVQFDGLVTVSVPFKTSLSDIDEFMWRNLPWVLQTRSKVIADTERERLPFDFADGGVMPLFGRTFGLRLDRNYSTHVDLKLGIVFVRATYSGDEEYAKFRLKTMLKREAERYLGGFIAELTPLLKHPLVSWRLSGAMTRWGSCSSSGRVNLNWRLVYLEPDLARYVVAHELAHLAEHNHSKRFWAECQRLDPLALEHRAKLMRMHMHYLPELD